MKTSLTIHPTAHGYDLEWEMESGALRWDDTGWVMETHCDGKVIDLVNVSLYIGGSSATPTIDWNAVMRRVEELTK